MIALRIAGCSSAAGDGLGASCAVSGVCESQFLCVFGLCHDTCTTSSDCSAGAACLLLGTPSVGVCQLPVETRCTILDASTSCAFGLVCDGREGCRIPCESIDTAPTCFGPQLCGVAANTALEVCLDPGELEGGSPDTVELPRDAGVHDARARDGGRRDGGSHDASLQDGRASDAPAGDSAAVDAPSTETGAADSGSSDARSRDSSSPDAGSPDGALPDAARDGTPPTDAASG